MIYFFLLFSWTEFLENAVVHSALFLEVSFMDSAVGARERERGWSVLFSFLFGNIFNFTLISPLSLHSLIFLVYWHPSVTSLVAQMVKRLPTMWETQVRSLGWEDPLEKEIATHSSTLAWKIPWAEEPGSLQSMGSQRVGHDSMYLIFPHKHMRQPCWSHTLASPCLQSALWNAKSQPVFNIVSMFCSIHVYIYAKIYDVGIFYIICKNTDSYLLYLNIFCHLMLNAHILG